jgi:hypothetical protein
MKWVAMLWRWLTQAHRFRHPPRRRVPVLGWARRMAEMKSLVDSKNKIRELCARWDKRITLKGQSLAELYFEGRLSLICYLDVSISPKAVASNPILKQSPIPDFSLCAIIKSNADACDVSEVGNCKQSSMFVFDIEVMDMQKRFPIPSTVGLDIYHKEIENPPGDFLFKSGLNGRFKFLPAFIDGEFGVLSVFPALRPFNVVDSQVQSRTQIVNDVTEYHADRIGTLVVLTHLKKIAGAIKVMLDERDAKVTVEESVDFGIQVNDVLFGPFNL